MDAPVVTIACFGMLTLCFLAIPKEHTVFRFTVPRSKPAEAIADGELKPQDTASTIPDPLVFELHGNQFENRPVDRANKKFKWRNIDYL